MEYPAQEQMNVQPCLPAEAERQTIFTDLEGKQLRFFKISYLILYLLTYFYSAVFFNYQTAPFFPFAIGLILLSETLIRKLAYPSLQIKNLDSRLETRSFLIMTLAQALALSLWGLHRQLEFFQFLAIHISFAFYILSRTGWLSQGRLGILVWFDAIQAFCILPFKNFIAAILVFIEGKQQDSSDSSDSLSSKKAQQLAIIVSSFFVAGILVYFVWSQLSQVSDSFASFFSNTADVIENLLDSLFSSFDSSMILFKACLAVPVSLYLYGLLAGSLLGKKDTKLSYKKFQASIRPMRVAPAFAAYIIIGSLCLTYALFFLTGLGELGQLLSAGTVAQSISPQNASTVAVAGFWQLVRVSILNFAVLGVFYLIAKKTTLGSERDATSSYYPLYLYRSAGFTSWLEIIWHLHLPLRTNTSTLDFSMVHPSSLGLVPTNPDSFLQTYPSYSHRYLLRPDKLYLALLSVSNAFTSGKISNCT